MVNVLKYISIVYVFWANSSLLAQLNTNCTNKLDSLYNEGYLCAMCIKTSINNDSLILGSKVKTFFLNQTDTLTTLQSYLNYRNNWLIDKNKEGYLTANCRLQIVNQTNSAVFFESVYDFGPKWQLDSVCSLNNKGIDASFLKRIIGKKRDFIWTPFIINQLKLKLAAVNGFNTENGKILLQIINNKQIVQLPVVINSQNFLSGIIGANTSETGTNKITGEVEGSFINMFNKGYSMFFRWESFRQNSQQFKISTQLPYLFGLPFCIEPGFEFQKFDSVYTNATLKANLTFPFSSTFRMQTGIENTNNSRISLNESNVLITKQLPLNPSFKSVLYHLGLKASKGNTQFFSKNLFQFFIQSQVGTRTFVKDARIARLTWKNYKGETVNIYDSLKNLRSLKYQLQLNAEWRFKITEILILKNKVFAEMLYLPSIFFNELKRYGGINSLIGFNEQSIFANKFYSYQTELRMQIASNGYIGLMVNAALSKNDWKQAFRKEMVFLGGGITGALQTKVGILQLAWAMGSVNKQSLNINQSKFHFGLVTSLSN